MSHVRHSRQCQENSATFDKFIFITCARACPIQVLLSRYEQNLYLRTPVRK